MKEFQHYIITRFNLPLNNGTLKDKNGQGTCTESWLEHRFRLFETYCIPSIVAQSNQNFKWLVLFHDLTPERFRRRIENYRNYKNFIPLYCPKQSHSNFIRANLPCADSFLITSRIDNDDAYSIDAVEQLQSEFKGQELEQLNLRAGYQLKGTQLYEFAHDSYHFGTIIQKTNQGQFLDILSFDHSKMSSYAPVRQIDQRLWLEVIHDRNILNGVWGVPCEPAEIELRFTIGKQLVEINTHIKSELNIGRELFNSGDYLGALQVFSALAEKDNLNPQIFNNLGSTYYKVGKLKQSILALEKAILLNPSDPVTYHNLTAVAEAVGQLEKKFHSQPGN